ncbi:hypothetical protein ACLK19_13895 [Escherichia coli]
MRTVSWSGQGGNRLSVKFDTNSRTLAAGKASPGDAGTCEIRDVQFHHIFHLRHGG